MTVLLVDGNNQAFVANMAIGLSTSWGHPTQAINGFLKGLHAYCDMFQPSGVAVFWDGGHSGERKALYPEYKANRDKRRTPEDEVKMVELKQQTPIIQKMLSLLGVSSFRGPGVEADDIIARSAHFLTGIGKRTVIISGDKDFLQLVSPQVSVYSTLSNAKVRHITHLNMEEAKGLQPEQWLEFRAMMGDTSDNIPGVNGIGKGTALKILQNFKTVALFIGAVNDLKHKPNRFEKNLFLPGAYDAFAMSKKLMDLSAAGMVVCDKAIKTETGTPGLDEFLNHCIRYELLEIMENFTGWAAAFPAFRAEMAKAA